MTTTTEPLAPGAGAVLAAVARLGVSDAVLARMHEADAFRLTDWARTRRTGAGRLGGLPGHLSSRYRLLTDEWGADPDTARGWLAAIVATPTVAEFTRLRRMLEPDLYEHPTPHTDWLPLGVLGPLAWAAGLSPAETRAAVHTPTDGRLRTLAALRGWQFPSLLP